VLACVFGWFAPSAAALNRVYFLDHHPALTFALMARSPHSSASAATTAHRLQGHPRLHLQASGTRAALSQSSCGMLALALIMCRYIVTSKFGKVLIATATPNRAPASSRYNVASTRR